MGMYLSKVSRMAMLSSPCLISRPSWPHHLPSLSSSFHGCGPPFYLNPLLDSGALLHPISSPSASAKACPSAKCGSVLPARDNLSSGPPHFRCYFTRGAFSRAAGAATSTSASFLRHCQAVSLPFENSPLPAASLDRSSRFPGNLGRVVRLRSFAIKALPELVLSTGSSRLGVHIGAQVTDEEASRPPRKGGKVVAVRDTVELTESEERIFNVLTATLMHFGLETQLRVAGGWVRDKLIGKNSVDIDIALDNMMGEAFCEKVNDYLQTIGEKTHSIGVIRSNPEQSKHLETANMQVLDMRIDFVNLRAETYTENSRIPEMVFGSPQQDAYRRDLTINSLFYNIKTRMVEDFTEKGIADLKAGIIRTPLPPYTTFLDDPLRVCRAIRFGARFDFTLDEGLKEAAASEAVRTALQNKVSRDRIGHEIDLMLVGNQPDRAMQHVEDLSLFSTVYLVPNELEPDPPIPKHYGRHCVDALFAVTGVLAKFKYASELSNDQRHLLLLAAMLLPLQRTTCFNDKKKRKKIPVSTYIIRDSLKRKNDYFSAVETLHNTALEFQKMMKQLLQMDVVSAFRLADSKAPEAVQQRVDLGILLRKSKKLWRGGLILASVMELSSVELSSGEAAIDGFSEDQAWIDEKAEICNTVEEVVRKLELTDVWNLKPLLGGNEIMTTLKVGNGQHVQEWKDRGIRWQLAHPDRTAEECKNWIVEENLKRPRTE